MWGFNGNWTRDYWLERFGSNPVYTINWLMSKPDDKKQLS